jgi:hypothetical protein
MTIQVSDPFRNERAAELRRALFHIANDPIQATDQACSQHRRNCSNVACHGAASSVEANSIEIMRFNDLKSWVDEYIVYKVPVSWRTFPFDKFCSDLAFSEL